MNGLDVTGYATDDSRRSPSPTGRRTTRSVDRRMSFGSSTMSAADVTGLPIGFGCYGNGRWSSLTRDGFRGSTSSLASINSSLSLQPAPRRESVIETLEKKRRESVSARLRNLQLQLMQRSESVGAETEGCCSLTPPFQPEAIIDLPIITAVPRRGRDNVLPRAPRRHSSAYQQVCTGGLLPAVQLEMAPLDENNGCDEHPASSIRRHSLSTSGLFGDRKGGTDRSLSVFSDIDDGEASLTSALISSKRLQSLRDRSPAEEDHAASALLDNTTNGLSTVVAAAVHRPIASDFVRPSPISERLMATKPHESSSSARNSNLVGEKRPPNDDVGSADLLSTITPNTSDQRVLPDQYGPTVSTCNADTDSSTEHNFYQKFSDNEDEYEPAATTTGSVASCDDISVDSFTYHSPAAETEQQQQPQLHRTSSYSSNSGITSFIDGPPTIHSSDANNFRWKRPTSLSAADLCVRNGNSSAYVESSLCNARLSPLEVGDRTLSGNGDEVIGWSNREERLRAAVSYPSVAMTTESRQSLVKSHMMAQSDDGEDGRTVDEKNTNMLVKYRSAIALSISAPSSASSTRFGYQSSVDSTDSAGIAEEAQNSYTGSDNVNRSAASQPAAAIMAIQQQQQQQRHVSELRIPASTRPGVSRSISQSPAATTSSSTFALFSDASTRVTDEVETLSGQNRFQNVGSTKRYGVGDTGNNNGIAGGTSPTSQPSPDVPTNTRSMASFIVTPVVKTANDWDPLREGVPPLPSKPPPPLCGEATAAECRLTSSPSKERQYPWSLSSTNENSTSDGPVHSGSSLYQTTLPKEELVRTSTEKATNDRMMMSSTTTWRNQFNVPPGGERRMTHDGQISSLDDAEKTSGAGSVEQEEIDPLSLDSPKPDRSKTSSVHKVCSQLIKLSSPHRYGNDGAQDNRDQDRRSPLSSTHRKPPLFIKLPDDKKPFTNGSKTVNSPLSPKNIIAAVRNDVTAFGSNAKLVEVDTYSKNGFAGAPTAVYLPHVPTTLDEREPWSPTSCPSPTRNPNLGSGTDVLFSRMGRTADGTAEEVDRNVSVKGFPCSRSGDCDGGTPYRSIPAPSVESIPAREVTAREKIFVTSSSAGNSVQRTISSESAVSNGVGTSSPFGHGQRKPTSDVLRIIPIVVENSSPGRHQQTRQLSSEIVSGAVADARRQFELYENGAKVVDENRKSSIVRRSRDDPDQRACAVDVQRSTPKTRASWSSVTSVDESVFAPSMTSTVGNSQPSGVLNRSPRQDQLTSKSTAYKSSAFASTVGANGANGIEQRPNEAQSVDRSWESFAGSTMPRATAMVRPRSASVTTPPPPPVTDKIVVSGMTSPTVALTPVSVQHETTIAVRSVLNGNGVATAATSGRSVQSSDGLKTHVPINGNALSRQSLTRSTSANDVVVTDKLIQNGVSRYSGSSCGATRDEIDDVKDCRRGEGSRMEQDDDDGSFGTADTFELDVVKSGMGLSFCIEGGKDSSAGDRPITVKRVFRASEQLWPGDQILKANGRPLSMLSHYVAWNYLKSLPEGAIRLLVRRPGAVTGVVSPLPRSTIRAT